MHTPHTTNRCPCHPLALVAVKLIGDGSLFARAGDLSLGPGLGPNGEGRVASYRVLTPSACKTRRAARTPLVI